MSSMLADLYVFLLRCSLPPDGVVDQQRMMMPSVRHSRSPSHHLRPPCRLRLSHKFVI